MLIGRLPRDPEMRTLPSGSSILSFAVATSRQWKDSTGEKKKQTEFHRAVAWGKIAETIGQYLFKGKQVYVDGRLRTNDWVGKDGAKRYRTEIVVDNVILLGGKPAAQTESIAAAHHEGDEVADENEAKEVLEEDIHVEAIPF